MSRLESATRVTMPDGEPANIHIYWDNAGYSAKLARADGKEVSLYFNLPHFDAPKSAVEALRGAKNFLSAVYRPRLIQYLE